MAGGLLGIVGAMVWAGTQWSGVCDVLAQDELGGGGKEASPMEERGIALTCIKPDSLLDTSCILSHFLLSTTLQSKFNSWTCIMF